jgi:parallel beta-helix repeat protein
LGGDVDIITDPEPSMFSTFNSDPDIILNDAGHSPVSQSLSMNTKKINNSYRKAISYAINYSYIIDELLENPADRLKSPLLEDLLFANWTLDAATFNITKAREIMQSMGFGGGWDTTFPGISETNWSSTTFASFNYSYNIGNEFRENLLPLLQDNLGNIGIEITDAGVSPLEFYDILIQRNGKTWDMWELCWLGYYIDYNDPVNLINYLFTNRTSSYNTAFYNGYEAAIEVGRDPFNLWDNVQLLMEAALFETNQSNRKLYYDRIQQILVEEDMPLAYGIVSRTYDAFRSHIIGFQSNPLGKLNFYGITQNSSLAPQIIQINGNQEWEYFRSANKCTGQGTLSDPYVVEDLVIDSGAVGHCILIENSDIFFNIENCTFYNGGIQLNNVSNGQLLSNNADNNDLIGISLIYSNFNNVTGNSAKNNSWGIELINCSNNLILGNNVSYNNYGINFQYSDNNFISENALLDNNDDGIYLLHSDGNIIIGNNVTNNDMGILLDTGSKFNNLTGNIARNNNFGIFFGTDSDNNTIEANRVENNSWTGIYLSFSDGNYLFSNNISNNLDYGIFTTNCFYNRILGNIVRNNSDGGIYLSYSSRNIMDYNTIEYNGLAGIYLYYSADNDILRNNLGVNYRGIYFQSSDHNLIEENYIFFNTQEGIYFSSADYNNILDNNINNNYYYGISIRYSYSNEITNNNIIENAYRGIYLYETNYNDILNNFISANGDRGISLSYSDSNTIEGNTIEFHYYGIYAYYCINNQISNNIFNGNTVDLEEIERPTYPFPPGITTIIVIIVFIIIIIIIGVVVASRRRSPSMTTYSKSGYYQGQKVEKTDYMNPNWLRYQYYDRKRTIYQIAQDQNTSIYTIRKWLDKIEEPIVVDPNQKETKFCTKCGQELPIKANFCIKCGEKSLESETEEEITEDQKPMFPPISDLVQKPDALELQEEPIIPPEEEIPEEPIPLIEEKDKSEKEAPAVLVREVEPIPLVPQEEEDTLVQDEEDTMIKSEEIPIEEIPETIIEEPPPPPVEKPKMLPIFCRFCGMKLNKTATICPQCGTRVKKS